MRERLRGLRWWQTALGVAVAVFTILALSFSFCDRAGLATPLEAASKKDVAANTERIQKLEENQAEVLGWLKAIGGALRVKYKPREKD